MRADGGEAVEVRKHEGLAEGTNEEDGRHGLRGCSEVGELVRMRSKRRRRGAVARRVVGGFRPLAEGTNEEDGRHGLRGCSEVGELVRTAKEGAVARR